MKKKIAIFEIEYHLGFVKTLVELIDFQKYEVTIFTVDNNLSDLNEYLKDYKKKVNITSVKKNLLQFIFNFYRESDKFDLCFHFSVQTHFLILPFRYFFFQNVKRY